MKKMSKAMERNILRLIKPWADDISQCDGRNLNGVAITIEYADERDKDAPELYYDYATITVQNVRWDGTRNRFERDIYIVSHHGHTSKLQ